MNLMKIFKDFSHFPDLKLNKLKFEIPGTDVVKRLRLVLSGRKLVNFIEDTIKILRIIIDTVNCLKIIRV